MELQLAPRIKRAWNAFLNRDPTYYNYDYGSVYSYRPDRPVFTGGTERSILASIINRIALDVSGMDIMHCDLDENGRFKSIRSSGLNDCLRLEANIDQTGRSFIQDCVISMFDEGAIAIVPVDIDDAPTDGRTLDVLSLRTGKILEWRPYHVKVRVYNERTGRKEDLILPKSMVGIVENPLYAIVNEPNSTMQRLKRKLALLDVTDEQTASGKLDLIIQLPYSTKSELRRQQAERRRKEVEDQLTNSKYGIAYADGTEKIVQLNRSLENNLMKHVEYLTNMLFSQLGMTQSILDGTADEQTMLNYYNRTIEPIVAAFVDEMKRKFLSKTARTQGQTIMAFRSAFKLVPVGQIAEIADKFTRNEIMTSNEIRQEIGMKPSKDPKADQLVNSNISQAKKDVVDPSKQNEETKKGEENQNGKL